MWPSMHEIWIEAWQILLCRLMQLPAQILCDIVWSNYIWKQPQKEKGDTPSMKRFKNNLASELPPSSPLRCRSRKAFLWLQNLQCSSWTRFKKIWRELQTNPQTRVLVQGCPVWWQRNISACSFVSLSFSSMAMMVLSIWRSSSMVMATAAACKKDDCLERALNGSWFCIRFSKNSLKFPHCDHWFKFYSTIIS